jgi:heat shock protein HslJ
MRRRRMRARAVVLGVLGLAIVLAAGCSRNDEVDSLSATYGLPSTRVDLEAEDWVLVRARSSLTMDDESPVTIAFDDARVSGTAPCNLYRGDLELDDDDIEITNISTTLRGCREPIAQAEAEYLAALERVDTVDVSDDDDEMLLTGDGAVRLAFRAYDAGDRLVGRWPIINVATGDALESVLPGTTPSVTFADDGALTLVTGCNTGHGSWELAGDELTVDPLRQTRKLCTDPDGIMQQEASLTKALESADRVVVAPGKLTILNSRGSIVLVAGAGWSR